MGRRRNKLPLNCFASELSVHPEERLFQRNGPLWKYPSVYPSSETWWEEAAGTPPIKCTSHRKKSLWESKSQIIGLVWWTSSCINLPLIWWKGLYLLIPWDHTLSLSWCIFMCRLEFDYQCYWPAQQYQWPLCYWKRSLQMCKQFLNNWGKRLKARIQR